MCRQATRAGPASPGSLLPSHSHDPRPVACSRSSALLPPPAPLPCRPRRPPQVRPLPLHLPPSRGAGGAPAAPVTLAQAGAGAAAPDILAWAGASAAPETPTRPAVRLQRPQSWRRAHARQLQPPQVGVVLERAPCYRSHAAVHLAGARQPPPAS